MQGMLSIKSLSAITLRLLNFLETVPSPEVVPVTPPPNADYQDRPQRDLCRVNYVSLHEYGREGDDAWSHSRREGDKKEDIEEDTQEEMEDTEDRGAPDS